MNVIRTKDLVVFYADASAYQFKFWTSLGIAAENERLCVPTWLERLHDAVFENKNFAGAGQDLGDFNQLHAPWFKRVLDHAVECEVLFRLAGDQAVIDWIEKQP